MFLRKVFNIFIKKTLIKKYWVSEISGTISDISEKYRVSEISVIRNIGYQKYRVSEISDIRNIGYQKYKVSVNISFELSIIDY